MTEYEASDRLMSLASNIIAMNDVQASHIAIYLSAVFAFIVASYVAGSKLTKFQAVIAYTLFTLFAAMEVFRIVSFGVGTNSLLETSVEWGSDAQVIIMDPTLRIVLTTFLWSIGGIGALLFMWSIRRTKNE